MQCSRPRCPAWQRRVPGRCTSSFSRHIRPSLAVTHAERPLQNAFIQLPLRCPRYGTRLAVFCAKRDNNAPHRKSTGPWTPWGWIQQLAGKIRVDALVKFVLNALLLLSLIRLWPGNGRGLSSEPQSIVVKVPFSSFVHSVKDNDVEAVSIDNKHVSYSLKSDRSSVDRLPKGPVRIKLVYSAVRPEDFPTPYEILIRNKVQFSAVDHRGNRFASVLMYAFYIALLLSLLNKLPFKLPSATTARRHKGSASNSSPITFADVAGVDEAKEELAEIVEFLKSPERFAKLGARPPCGVLLVGPPGTGKTLLAKAVAGEAGVPFFSISASEFVELYVGMGAMRVRELFAAARKEAPAIVFIDEIDAVAKGRDTRLRSVGNDEREQTLNQLLTELDGFESDKDNVVICIAATNRPDVLDAALLRPGRFDRRVAVERPDRVGRQQILQVHLQRRNLPLSKDVSVDMIAGMTTGFTGADLANLVNEAALLAGRHGKSTVDREEFDTAILRAIAGIEKKRSVLKGLEKSVVAKHEVGHAMVSTAVAELIPGAAQVEKLSIVPRSGGALGFTYIPATTEDRALMFSHEVRGQLAMLLGGRAAEILCCSHISTGASDDIKRATDLAMKAVSEFGLSEEIGPLSVSVLEGSDDGGLLVRDGGAMSRRVQHEVKRLVEAAQQVAKDVIDENKVLHAGLSSLLEKDERLESEQLQKWLQHVKVPDSLRRFVIENALPTITRHTPQQSSNKNNSSSDAPLALPPSAMPA